MGETDYCRWIAEEGFRAPRREELLQAVIAAEWGNAWTPRTCRAVAA